MYSFVINIPKAILLLLLPSIIISCDSGGSSDLLSLGSMRAQVNGSDWRATATKGAGIIDQGPLTETLWIQGVSGDSENPGHAIQLGIGSADPPSDINVTSGTYNVSQEGIGANYCDVSADSEEFCRDRESDDAGLAVSGEITIENIDDTSVRGRFEFETSTASITNGRFHLALSRSSSSGQ